MKKTISINLNNQNFIIEEEVYTKLQNYLESVKDHLGEEVDKTEVMKDIESSIAEKLKNSLNSNKNVINNEDIESVIKVIGTTEDFDREMGMPNEKIMKEKFVNKKLYRDTDNRILGGVASGLGHYFNINPTWIRLILVLVTILPFPLGFSGSGILILLYIILWIIVPPARTSYQKLEMYGQNPTLDAFKNLSIASQAGKSSAEIFGDKLEKLAITLWKIIKGIVGIFMILGGVFGIAFAGFGALTSIFYKGSGYAINFIPISEITSLIPFNLMTITGFFSIAIPSLFIILAGIYLLKKRKPITLTSLIILAGIWMISFIVFVSLGVRYFPTTIERLENYPTTKYTEQNLDLSQIQKISAEGGHIRIYKDDPTATSTTLSGRQIDLDHLKIEKTNNTLSISEIPLTPQEREKCLGCTLGHVLISLPTSTKIEIATSSGAYIIEPYKPDNTVEN